MPETVTIPNKPFWARILAAFWAVESVMGLVFAAVGASWLGGQENGMAWLLIVMGLLLAAAGVMMADVTFRIARLKGHALSFSEAGFQDRRLSEAVIPWADIAWKVVFNGHSYSLQFNLSAEARGTFRLPWSHRVMSALNRAFRYPEFTVLTLGTGLRAGGIGELMAQFKPPAN